MYSLACQASTHTTKTCMGGELKTNLPVRACVRVQHRPGRHPALSRRQLGKAPGDPECRRKHVGKIDGFLFFLQRPRPPSPPALPLRPSLLITAWATSTHTSLSGALWRTFLLQIKTPLNLSQQRPSVGRTSGQVETGCEIPPHQKLIVHCVMVSFSFSFFFFILNTSSSYAGS